MDKYLRIGVLLTAALFVQLCAAQDWPSNGQGYSPLPPATPATSASPGMRERQVVPGPPMQPTVTSRPSAWPGAQPEGSQWVPPDQRSMSSQEVVPLGEMKPCEGAGILARVGSDPILESEVAGAVNETLEAHKAEIPASQLDQIRKMLTQQRLKPLIETKLIFLDAKHTIPSESWSHIEQQLKKEFEEVELPKLMKKAEVSTPREFDQKLRTLGTSLERLKRSSLETTLAREWIHQQIKPGEEPTLDQMIVYYRQHTDEFTTPTRAKWEELMVRYSKYPEKRDAYEVIGRMGNQVWSGASLAEVAKADSDGATANSGGQYDWTTKGALVCKELDAAIFSLPQGQLSPIIEGPVGFHIIRVTQRQETVVKPFLEAQVDIKEKIKVKRSDKQLSEYMAKLQAKTFVWTIFDDDPANVQTASRPQTLQR